GTFTDVVAKTPLGVIKTAKLLSVNPNQYRDPAIAGIRRLMGMQANAPLPANDIGIVKLGTTVATNALLERQGEPMALVTTKGFADGLKIAYQNRPDIFARNILLPEQLYQQVVEVEERVDAIGKIITPLDVQTLRTKLQALYDDGLRAIAIVFMHAYRFFDHEQAAGAIADEIGFTQISLSHQVSPLIKYVGRGDTSVVDAYLSPILRRYIDQVTSDLGDVRVQFMQSHGGLTDATQFRGKDAILSGPAGGIVGAVGAGKTHGKNRLISFDMGGTSTDVAHYADILERDFETVVAGVRLRTPMMRIHTVAAGGGSICQFRDGRYQVGPQSAGARPGPAAYGLGGPMTVTDCNIALGKLVPEFFPNIFGPNFDAALNVQAVDARLATLAVKIGQETGHTPSHHQIASGFLRIAIENMANAIKKISV
ncbi:MAG: hydantoinase/oxoprolinase family protein, partial [Pseudomonadota bacterium]